MFEKILVRRVCALGDLILTIPFLQAIRENAPEASVHLLAHQRHVALLSAFGLIGRGFSEENSGWHLIFSTEETPLEALRPNPSEYDRVCVFVSNPETSTLFDALHRNLGKRVLAIRARPPFDRKIHASRFFLDHLTPYFHQGTALVCDSGRIKLVGNAYPMPRSETSSALDLSFASSHYDVPFATDTLARLLNEAPLNDSVWKAMPKKRAGILSHMRKSGRLPVILHPGSGSTRKNWPVRSFARLIRILKSSPLISPLILEGPHDAFAAQALKKEIGRLSEIEILRVDDLLELTSCLHECCLYIGNDSGVTHLSAFVGTRTIAVFGPSDPLQWAPLGRNVRVLSNPQDCSPCHSNEQRNCPQRGCVRFPSEQEVARAALDFLNLP